MAECRALSLCFKHQNLLREVSKIHEMLKKLDPVITQQNKILEDKEELAGNKLDQKATAKFLQTFIRFDAILTITACKLTDIQNLSCCLQRAIIVHYQLE